MLVELDVVEQRYLVVVEMREDVLPAADVVMRRGVRRQSREFSNRPSPNSRHTAVHATDAVANSRLD